jgi:hypothetical protein
MICDLAPLIVHVRLIGRRGQNVHSGRKPENRRKPGCPGRLGHNVRYFANVDKRGHTSTNRWIRHVHGQIVRNPLNCDIPGENGPIGRIGSNVHNDLMQHSSHNRRW